MSADIASTPSAQPILQAIRIIDLCTAQGPSLAAQFLAECGADVIRIEPPGGGVARGQVGGAIWNRSKRAMCLDIDAERGTLDALLQTADVLLHDFTPAQVRAHRLQADQLRAAFPHLIVANVTGMPAGHPDEDLPLVDSLVLARGGLFDVVQPTHRQGPMYLRFPLGQQCSAYLAAIGILARLRLRNQGHGAGPVRTSLLQGALIPLMMHWHRARKPNPSILPPPKDLINVLVQCRDGVWLHLMTPADHCPHVKSALDALGPERCAEARASNQPYMAHLPLFPLYADIFRQRDSRDWLEELWAHDVAVEAAAPYGQLYFDEQARINRYVIEVDDPQLGATLQPGSPLSITPPAQLRWAQRSVGQDTQAILRELESVPPRTPAASAGSTSRRPLEGVRVLDIGNFLAGPLAPSLMADLGATVIKLEATSGDQMRWVEWAFAGAQRGKRCIAVDLKSPDARVVVERLVRWADVVHHNLRLPAAEKLGLGYTTLRQYNPSIIYCHVSAYGPVGPRKDWPGFDQMMQSSAGWEVAAAGEGNAPMWNRLGMTDHVCALSSLLTTMLALYERDRTGQGQYVSASLLGATVMTLAETVARPDGELLPVATLNRDQTGVSPHQRMYECSNGWISLYAPQTAESGSDGVGFDAFCSACHAGSVDELETALRALSREQATARAREYGIYAVPVASGSAFIDDPEYQRLGLTTHYAHPVYERLDQIGALWNFDDIPLHFDMGPPTLGQHSSEILRELGFSDAEIAQMVADKLVRESLNMQAIP